MFKNGNDFVGEIKREINAGNESLSVLIKIGEPDSVYMVWASLDKVMSKATEMPCFKISEASPDWKAFKVGQGITQELSKIYAFRFLDKQGKMVTLRTRNSTVK